MPTLPSRQSTSNPNQSIQTRLSSAIDNSIQAFFAPFPNLISALNPFPYFQTIGRYINQFLSSPTTHRSLLGSIIFGVLFSFSILISIIAYVSFYWSYVPQIGLTIPLWLQYGEGRVPYASIDLRKFTDQIAIDQAYNVNLRLTVPAHDRNFELGNFMTRLTLTTSSPLNTTLHHVSRHASLIYEPYFARILLSIKYLRTLFFFSAPHIVQHLDIGLLEQTIINPNIKKNRLGTAKIEVGRDDELGELHVYDATLVFDAHLDGLRAMMYYHPYLSFSFFCTLFMTAQFASVLLTWAIIVLRRNQTENSTSTPSYNAIKKESISDFPTLPLTPASTIGSHTTRRGMSDIDDLLGPDEEHTAIDDEEIEEDKKPLLSTTPVLVKPEEIDDDELLGGSETTGASGTRSFGSDLGRTASSASS
ncbi:hypothetical protein CROQUDRAFT_674842 [Cronartium quercuum f. sp. fusiforme G11]|uniref:Seipin n=1 Tax=Cronartium quercuum f. sp. fusiforme G11 TaxID=708437 RepID=A0A9P6T661_9BASI|nr:hypothetical protein CROQUDRAFT_674842 [Cronartium quercuum f. sp. fusiforme G11]